MIKKHTLVFTLIIPLVVLFFGCRPEVEWRIGIQDSEFAELIDHLSLKEKIAMIHASSSFTSGGVKRLGIPELVVSDGPHGVRREHGRDWVVDSDVDDAATYLPTGVGLAATWNRDLGYEFGKVLGSEAKYRGKDVILGPGVNIMRTPLNGRNFEYLSEDPYLSGQMSIGYIKGVQENGVAACLKHYVANNQETERHTINVEMSERALREIYLPAFKTAVVDAGVWTVMGSYNKFRGQHATHNKYLINDILKGEWNFDGILMSDWASVHDTKEALLNGVDLEFGTELDMLPNADYDKFYLAKPAFEMIKNGEVEESVVDEKVERILRTLARTKLSADQKEGSFNTKEHQDVALRVARESLVLLKNEGGILPLKEEQLKSIAVIGANANHKHGGAGGSSQVKAKYEITPLEGLRKLIGDGEIIKYAQGYSINRDSTSEDALVEEAAKMAAETDIAIIFGGWIHGWTDEWDDNAFDAEAFDKKDIVLPFGQDELIESVSKANPNTIVVLFGGAATDMSGWADYAKAIVQVWYPGMEGGTAISELLSGKINPSGKMPVTFPKKLEDHPAHTIGEFPGEEGVVNYKEDIFVGYRYFDTYQVEPLYCFGFGLSYTSYEYSNLQWNQENGGVELSFDITNTGEVAGAEIAQLYVRDNKSSVPRPDKELKGFDKIYLEAGETGKLTLKLSKEAFMFYDEDSSDWKMEDGNFTLLVGSSSRDIRLSAQVEMMN